MLANPSSRAHNIVNDIFHSNVPKKKDFPELITAQWETFENHSQGIFRLFFPIEDGDWEKESAEKY